MQMFQNLRRTMKPGDRLKIQCEACDHRATLTQDDAVSRCGPDATPMEIRRRAQCRSCGAGGRARVWI